jgi:hypothetical protein
MKKNRKMIKKQVKVVKKVMKKATKQAIQRAKSPYVSSFRPSQIPQQPIFIRKRTIGDRVNSLIMNLHKANMIVKEVSDTVRAGQNISSGIMKGVDTVSPLLPFEFRTKMEAVKVFNEMNRARAARTADLEQKLATAEALGDFEPKKVEKALRKIKTHQ